MHIFLSLIARPDGDGVLSSVNKSFEPLTGAHLARCSYGATEFVGRWPLALPNLVWRDRHQLFSDSGPISSVVARVTILCPRHPDDWS
jgi:hypothetical protein